MAGGVGVGGALNVGGNVAIGTTPNAWGYYDAGTIQKSYGAFWASNSNQSAFGWNCYFNGSNWIYSNSNNASIYAQTSGQHQWYTTPSGTAGNAISFTQAMTLDASGNLLVNSTTNDQWYTSTNAGFTLNSSNFLAIARSGGSVFIANRLTSDGDIIEFKRSGSGVGTISITTTATAYNTSSDKRLKTPLRPWSLGDKFDDLPIGEFNWLKTGSLAHGTLAQDLYEIYPDAVSVGTDEKDINGNLKHPWSVDYGKLTVPLIAEVKSLRSRVKTLEQEQATTTQQLNDLTAKFNQYISTHP